MANANDLTRARQKFVAIKRAEWRLKQRLETIDNEYDVVMPGVQELERAITEGKKPVFEIEAR